MLKRLSLIKSKQKDNKGKLILQVASIDDQGNLNISLRQGLLNAREIILVITGHNKRSSRKTV